MIARISSLIILATFLISIAYPALGYMLTPNTIKPETYNDVALLRQSNLATISPSIKEALDKNIEKNIVPDKIIVVYKPGALKLRANIQLIDRLNYQFGFKVVKRLTRLNMDIVKLPTQFQIKSYDDLQKIRSIYLRLPFVAGVYPDVKYSIELFSLKQGNKTVYPQNPGQENNKIYYGQVPEESTPMPQASLNLNDTYADDLWNLEFINAEQAWNYTMGSPDVVVAVIDSGITPHADLFRNLWINPNEIPFNGKDDDGNGYIDDIYGYDFAENDSYPLDTIGHGTCVAGVIAALANNSIGVAGVAPHVKVMALKAAPDNAYWLDEDAILAAIDYVITMKQRGVNIVAVSASWGAYWGNLPPDLIIREIEYPMYTAIASLYEHGVLFVNAAGNSGSLIDSDRYTETPAEYGLPNIIVVGSIDYDGRISSFSNYGYESVDLMAPGNYILSTYGVAYSDGAIYTDYAWCSGTSASTPHVSGVVALIASLYEKLGLNITNPAMAAKMALLFSAYTDKVVNGENVSVIGYAKAGYLDAYSALSLVANNSQKLDALLLKPAPLPQHEPTVHWTVTAWWTARTIVAGFNYTYEILVGTPTGPVSGLTVEVRDASGNLLGVLHDDGNYPDQVAGDGIYSGEIVLPVNQSALGQVELRNLTFVVKNNNGATLLQKTYTFKVLNVGATYQVNVSNNFIWVDTSKEVTLPPAPVEWHGMLRFSGNFTLFGVPASKLAENLTPIDGVKKYVIWEFTKSPQIMLGADVNEFYRGPSYGWWCSCHIEPVSAPATMPGVVAVISALSRVSDPYAYSYGWWCCDYPDVKLHVFTTTLEGHEATVLHYYSPRTQAFGYDNPVDVEVIILDNGTIIMSYKHVPIESNVTAFIALNKEVAVVADLYALAGGASELVNKTIIFNPVPITGPAPPPPAFNMEWGVVSVTNVPKFVKFAKNYTEPVVVAGPPTRNGAQAAISYVYKVNSTGFLVGVREWDYLDGVHIAENVSYLVVEAGAHKLSDGRVIEAGYANATTDQWTWISFPEPFNKTPVVVASIASNTTSTVTIRIKGVNTTGFWALLEPEEDKVGKVSVAARIAWVAIEPGNSTTLVAGYVDVPAGNNPSVTDNFNTTFTEKPIVLASIATYNGPDPVILRITSLTQSSVTFMLQEDTSKDSEIYHTTETIAYIVLPPS